MSPLTLGRAPQRQQNPQTAAEVLALSPPTRLDGINPIIPFGGAVGTWRNGQTMEPCVVPDPTDAGTLIMYLGGQGKGVMSSGVARATALASDPTNWSLNDTPVLVPGTSGAWDDGVIRCDSVVYDPVADEFKLYYTGWNETFDQIGLATSPGDDGVTFTKHPSNPIFTPGQAVGGTLLNNVSQAAVWREDADSWFMYYCHRGNYGTLPSIRLATSPDGVAWTDQNITSWPQGAAGTYDDTYKEWHQITKIGDTYVLVGECYDGQRWTIGAATSPTPDGVFTKRPAPIFAGSGVPGSFDEVHTATPAIYNLNDRWFLFYQGTDVPVSQNYSFGYWSIGMAQF